MGDVSSYLLCVICPAYSACQWTCSTQTKPKFSLKLPSSSFLSLPLIDQRCTGLFFFLFLAVKPRCWHILAMPCTCFSCVKTPTNLHHLQVPPLSPLRGLINEKWMQLCRNVGNKSGFMASPPPFSPF
ncbi:hypothetical protein Nmel_001663 [Mimus melanotis]